MSETDETVADVLLEIDDLGQEYKLREVVAGERDPDTLGYEDWVRPMKLTGGRVCLHLPQTTDTPESWIRWTPHGLQISDGEIVPIPPSVVMEMLKSVIGTEIRDPEPVLRADTPFAEAETDEA